MIVRYREKTLLQLANSLGGASEAGHKTARRLREAFYAGKTGRYYVAAYAKLRVARRAFRATQAYLSDGTDALPGFGADGPHYGEMSGAYGQLARAIAADVANRLSRQRRSR